MGVFHTNGEGGMTGRRIGPVRHELWIKEPVGSNPNTVCKGAIYNRLIFRDRRAGSVLIPDLNPPVSVRRRV